MSASFSWVLENLFSDTGDLDSETADFASSGDFLYLTGDFLYLTGDFMVRSVLKLLTIFSRANLDFSKYISNSMAYCSEIYIFS